MSPSSETRGRDTRLLTSDLVDDVEFLTARARAVGTFLTNRHLAPLGLRARSYSVLALAAGEHAPTQRELADFLRLDPSQIVDLIDQLERDGLVERRPDPADRRSKIVVATDHGTAVHRDALRAVRRGEDEALAALDADERRTLRELLRKVAFVEVPPGDGA